MNRSPLSYLSTSLVALSLMGCGEPVVQETPAPSESTPTDGPVLGSPQPEAVPAKAESDAPEVEQTVEEAYVAPFPERVDIFAAPSRKGVTKSNGEQGEAVELLGFSNVHQPQALLLVNGEVSPLAAGDSFYGIKVLSIQPPVVNLEQGKQRTQLSLAN
ncbi:hypothetical protein [Adhaeretor mobilis]|uniref:Uncharacterized protein n=1 Tax=Adhaeretor mobilis TaxID=1930276 RepID=A0A517MWV4_9BACT|nr:hypothetical protein [Adhaeretor mobilis]QDS99365.1 hypothetical protein HG15A2_26880 [Adhaeretor mobilis]